MTAPPKSSAGHIAADRDAAEPPRPVTETELRETAAALAASEQELRRISDHVPVSIARIDRDLRYTFVNRHLAERHGLPPRKIVGRTPGEVINDEAMATFEPYLRGCLAGATVEFEADWPTPVDPHRIMQIHLAPEWWDGQVSGLVSASIDVTSLKLAEAALRDSEAAFRAMFEVSSVGKVECDCETGRHLRANSAVCRFLGYTEAELLERTMFDVTPPEDRGRDRELLLHLGSGICPVVDLEKRYIRKDGGLVWARTTINVVRDAAGRAQRSAAVIIDVTDRKRREERERLLKREVSHRARNMLNVVQAIAQQTAVEGSEDFLERFTARVQALSVNQDLLVRNEWHGVETGDLVRGHLHGFAALFGSRITLRGRRLRLSGSASQAIGLALHDLAASAASSGALSTDSGHVDVAWQVDGDTFTMAWTEHDGPAVAAPRRHGYRTVLTEAMAGRAVGGTVELACPPSGVTWRLSCPVANVRDPSDDAGDDGACGGSQG